MCDRIDISKKILNDNLSDLKMLYPNFRYSSVRIRKDDNRLVLVIYFSLNGKEVRKGTQVAKLLLELKLKRILDSDETTDHIDGDPSNDSIDNLQVLSRSENSKKGPSEEIKRKVALENSKRMLGVTQEYNNGESHPSSKLSDAQVLEIKELQKKYVFGSGQDKELSEKYGVSRSTIKGIRLGYSRKLK
jgi:hypothetical protein